jgi:hypothetical protein
MGQNRDVIALLKPVEEANADNLAIAYMIGMALLRDGQVQEGQQRVDKILRNGDSAEARFMLGSQMLAAQDFPAAVKQFAGAIELNPDLQTCTSWASDEHGIRMLQPRRFANSWRPIPTTSKQTYLAQILPRKQWTEAEPLIRKLFRSGRIPFRKTCAADLAWKEPTNEGEKYVEAAEKSWPESLGIHQRLSEFMQRYIPAQGSMKAVMARCRQSYFGMPKLEIKHRISLLRKWSRKNRHTTDLRHTGPVLLVFGSYTCPNFAEPLAHSTVFIPNTKTMSRFTSSIFMRLTPHIWASTQNQREGITLQPLCMDERGDHATLCVRKLHIEFPYASYNRRTEEQRLRSRPSKAICWTHMAGYFPFQPQ